MPKFLDRPQWFDDWGRENFSSGVQYIEVDNGDTIVINSSSGVAYPPGRYYLKWTRESGYAASISFSFTGGSIPLTFSYNPMEEYGINLYGLDAVYFDLYVLFNKQSSNSVCYVVFHNLELQNQREDTIDDSVLAQVSYGSSFAITSTGSTTTIQKNLTSFKINNQSSYVGDVIYAPVTNPAGGKILQSTGSGAPSWTSFMVNGTALGTTGNTSIYAPTTSSANGYAVAWVDGKPQWRTQLYVHNLHLYFDGASSGNSLIFSVLLATEESMEAYSDRLNILSNLMFNQYNNCTISATGRTSAGGAIIGVAAINISQFSITETTLSGGHNTFTRDIEAFGLVRDYVFPIIGKRADYDM